MTITLTLAPELEFKLKQEADRRGLPPEQYALEVLDKNIADADEPTNNKSNVIVATANVKHIARFVPADLWQNIS